MSEPLDGSGSRNDKQINLQEVILMRSFTKLFVVGLIAVFAFISCAKQPTQVINDAKAAVEAAVKDGATIYAKDELAKVNSAVTAAMDEITAQSKKLFKKYGNAKQMLLQAKTDAEAVKALIPARKEEAKATAVTAQTEAKAALDEAKALLDKAPKGKGTKADIEAMKADLKGLEESFPAVQTALDSEDFFGAKDKAVAIKEKAVSISEQVKAAIAKVTGKK